MTVSRFELAKLFKITTIMAIMIIGRPMGVGAAWGAQGDGEIALTREELRACVVLDREIDSVKRRVLEIDEELRANDKTLNYLQKVIGEGISALTRKAEKDEYKKKIKLFDDTKVLYAKNLEEYNRLLEKHRESVDKHKNLCADKKYDEDDYEEIIKSLSR